MKNKIGFWMLFLAGVFLIRLMIFRAAFWNAVFMALGYLALTSAVVFFVYVVFIRWFLVNLKGGK